jgi:tetratricopeptide (TPR) repeat protein
VTRHPRAPIAHYLQGDALARLEQWDQAVQALQRALDIRHDHYLALNARGAVYAAQSQWTQALLDYDAAIQANATFADAYASRGTLAIQRRQATRGAVVL